MLDFPTPELPVKALSFPASSRRSSSIPWPVTALTRSTRMAEPLYIPYSSSAGSRSHLFRHSNTRQSFRAAMALMRSMRYGSVTGRAAEAMITSWSMLAAAGRSKALRRGSTASTKPSPPPSSRTWTQSPTRGDNPSRRNLPRARH